MPEVLEGLAENKLAVLAVQRIKRGVKILAVCCVDAIRKADLYLDGDDVGKRFATDGFDLEERKEVREREEGREEKKGEEKKSERRSCRLFTAPSRQAGQDDSPKDIKEQQ